MRSRIPFTILVLGVLLGGTTLSGQALHSNVTAKKDNLPRILGATLLVGAPYDLALTTGNATTRLQPDDSRDGARIPSISASGGLIAFAKFLPDRTHRVVSTLAVEDKTAKWVDHESIACSGTASAISPDGTKLACSRHNSAASWNIEILDLRSGKVSESPQMSRDPGREISWSSNGQHVAFEMDDSTDSNIYTIYIFDIETRTVRPVGIGRSPSWSPSGEWIAFVAYVPSRKDQSATWCHAGQCYEPGTNSISLMTPEGTKSQTLMAYRSDVYGVAPVWSPDSKTLLINKSRNAEIDSYDIYLVDIATGKSTRKFKNTEPVSGWVEAHSSAPK